MNINTLTSYLSELLTLRAHYATQDRGKAKDLQTKIMDALKELDLYDLNSVRVGNLNFKSLSSYIPDPYYDSLSSLISHLESKIDVYKHRIETAALRDKKAQEQTHNLNTEQFKVVNNALILANEKLSIYDKEIKKLHSTITQKDAVITDNNDKLTRKNLIWKITSIGFWTFIVGIFTTISFQLYELGKDNATKADDVEKASLRSANKNMQDSINMLIFDIDSLKNEISLKKKLIRKVSPMD